MASALDMIEEEEWVVWYESSEAMERSEETPRGSIGGSATGAEITSEEEVVDWGVAGRMKFGVE